jgi:hypothetical protein
MAGQQTIGRTQSSTEIMLSHIPYALSHPRRHFLDIPINALTG